MAEDEKFKIKLPGKLVIEVTEEGEEVAAHVEEVAAASRVTQGILEGRRRAPYLHRKGGGVYLYDLGTRLKSVASPHSPPFLLPADDAGEVVPEDGQYNEYVEIDISTPLIGGQDANIAPAPEEVRQKLLHCLGKLLTGEGTDPTDFTPANGSGRLIPNAMPLPYGKTKGHGRVTLYQGTDSTEYALDEPDYVKEDGQEGEGERWNPLNVSDGTALDAGKLDIADAIESGHIIVGVENYLGFDTGRPDVFITTEPSFEAPHVIGDLELHYPLRIYLLPPLYYLIEHTGAGAQGAGTFYIVESVVSAIEDAGGIPCIVNTVKEIAGGSAYQDNRGGYSR